MMLLAHVGLLAFGSFRAPPGRSLPPQRGCHFPAALMSSAPPPSPPPPEPEQDAREPSTEQEQPGSLRDDFEAGQEFGRSIRSRFLSPRIDDRGLPIADSLVVVSGTIGLAIFSLSGVVPGRPSWLVPPPLLSGLPRGLPYIPAALNHGAALAVCWLLGALAASAFEKEAFCGSLADALARTWKAGAFATGVLLLCTQFATYSTLSAAGIDPVDTSSAALDLRLSSVASEVVADVAVQAVGLTAFRTFRWWDAQQPRGKS